MPQRITRMSEKGRDWMAAWEGGYRLKAYLCPAGVWTISAGVTRYGGNRAGRVQKKDTLASIDEAKALFQRTLKQYEDGVDALTRDDVVQHEFDALVSFVWNLGVRNLERSTLIKWVNVHRTREEIRQQFIKWRYADVDHARPGLEEVEGLRRRREAEALVYAGGPYLDDDEMAVREREA
jgi:lysozyme